MARPETDSLSSRYPGVPTVAQKACPIATTLGTLGRKWTITILRDIAFFPDASFSLILKGNPGLLPRTLSLRLKQLGSDGLIVRDTEGNGGRNPKYRLSTKGLQVWPILATLAQYGMQNFSEQVFEDGLPRDLEEVFPNGMKLMLGRFANSPPRRTPPSRSLS
ncbi:MAG: helix-turn-helix transcriptional regulator [Thermoplasmata archaeon]|jgi:DNA-binding HxlR family transcriptional regulator|nr:helix-turn-helix transcriptional regulator [Thermoplasmata archaeon]